MLKETFISLLSNYTANEAAIAALWSEIEKNYSASKRHYHTLCHLEEVLSRLQEAKEMIAHWDAILFALFYHDIVYNALRTDNEEKSAALAVKRMTECAVPAELIELCQRHILATKSHTTSADTDTNYFTDADLAILGQPWPVYQQYTHGVRKEYSIYPDFMYNPGRTKVLRHFLAMERIFKTDLFYSGYEKQARENLNTEIQLLG